MAKTTSKTEFINEWMKVTSALSNSSGNLEELNKITELRKVLVNYCADLAFAKSH